MSEPVTARMLAVDTSTEACSAALACGGEVIERIAVAPRQHAHLILGMIDSLMAEAGLVPGQLEAVTFGRGPGAFTGVRIAAAVAQGIALAVQVPVVPVSTLAALAQGAMDDCGVEGVVAAIDARMGEVYWGIYRRDAAGFARLVGEERVSAPGDLEVPVDGLWHGAGSGWASYAAELSKSCADRLTGVDPERLPAARSVLRLGFQAWRRGEGEDVSLALPVYLRDRVV